MRVARIITRLNRGGPARTLIATEPFLREQGVQQVVWTGECGPGEDDLGAEARARGLEVRVLPGLGRSIRPGRDLRAWNQLRRELAEFRPQIVHSHTFKAGLLARTVPLPGTVARFHTFHGHLFEHSFPAAASAALVRVERALARRSTALFAVSATVRRDLCERFHVAPHDRIHLLPGTLGAEFPGLLDREAARRRTGLDPRRRVVGCLARLASIKAPRRFLDLAQELIRRRADLDLVWVGDGPLRADFEAEIRQRGLESRVRRVGWQASPADWHRSLDVEVLLSDGEGLPLSLVEARAQEVPVVAGAVGGVGDLVEDGVDGWLVGRCDVAAARDRVLQVLDDPARARQMAARARRRDGRRFLPATHARRLLQVYRRWVPGPGQPTERPERIAKSRIPGVPESVS